MKGIISYRQFNYIRRIVGMILLFAFFGPGLQAQNPVSGDTVQERRLIPESPDPRFSPIASDSVLQSEIESDRKINGSGELEHSPQKAMYYSLVLPGLGQAYNKKYFKIPVVYGVLGGVGYWIYYNTDGYRQASANYSEEQTDTNLRYLKAWRRNLELSYISMVAAHALQVLDAYVDAHLFYWDVSPDLTLRMEPSFQPLYMPSGSQVANYGIKCSLTF